MGGEVRTSVVCQQHAMLWNWCVGGGGCFGTHLHGPHQSVCWLRPKRARHFLGEPGSEHNARHAQKKQEEEQKQ